MPDHGQRRRRSPARLLAPLALLAVSAALAAVILNATGSDGNGGGETTTRSGGKRAETTASRQRRGPRRASYTVKLNDTLASISRKTGVSIERLQALNPELDPQNLVVGQKIKLRE